MVKLGTYLYQHGIGKLFQENDKCVCFGGDNVESNGAAAQLNTNCYCKDWTRSHNIYLLHGAESFLRS